MPKCGIDCPKVREQLRTAIAEAPWLLDGTVLPRGKDDVDSRSPRDFVSKDTRDEPKRAIVPSIDHYEKITMDIPSEATEDIVEPKPIQEQAVIQETRIVQEPAIIQESEIVEEPTVIREQRIVQEIITQEPTVITIKETIDHDGEKIDLVGERELVIEGITVETAKEVPDAIDEPGIVRDEKDRRTAPIKFELEPSREPDADLEPERPVEYGDGEEGITDYDRFIDEELRESLAAVIAKEIPEEPEVLRREISKDTATIYEEIGREEPIGPPKERETMVTIPEAEKEAETRGRALSPRAMQIISHEAVRAAAPAAAEDACDETCLLLNGQKERIMHELEERQRVIDCYYLTRGFNYFKERVCTCSLACVLYTLSRDQFVRSIFASLALFAVGLKLCSELDAWEMPSRVI